MSSFSRAVAAVFVAGMVGGAGGLMLMPGAAVRDAAEARVPDPPTLPCKRQAWANADRGCMTWTTPQGELARAAERAAQRVPPREEVAQHQVVQDQVGHERALPVTAGLVPALPPRRVAATVVAPTATPDDAPQAARPVPAVKYLAETAVGVGAATPVAAPLTVALVAPVASSAVPGRSAPVV